jgi:hypothetical protein
MIRTLVGTLAALLLGAGLAHAAPITFFSEDAGNGDRIATPNSNTARGQFQAAVPGNTTQNLDGLAASAVAPLAFSFGSIGASLTGGAGGLIVSLPDPTTDGQGGFPISNNNIWQVEGSPFQIKLNKKVTAFGFYGIDIGDAGGQVAINLDGVAAPAINHSLTLDLSKATNGSVFFWGIINDVPFDTIDVLYSNVVPQNGVIDRFNFDDFMVGPEAQAALAPTPEPGTLLLLGSSLAGVGSALWRRRKMAAPTE